MYEKDKTTRITLRLNEQQFDFVKANADIMGVSPSEFLRIVINSTMAMTSKASETIRSRFPHFNEEATRRENEQTNQHNIV